MPPPYREKLNGEAIRWITMEEETKRSGSEMRTPSRAKLEAELLVKTMEFPERSVGRREKGFMRLMS